MYFGGSIPISAKIEPRFLFAFRKFDLLLDQELEEGDMKILRSLITQELELQNSIFHLVFFFGFVDIW